MVQSAGFHAHSPFLILCRDRPCGAVVSELDEFEDETGVLDGDWVDPYAGTFNQHKDWKADLKGEHLAINGHTLRVSQMHKRWDEVHEMLGGACSACMADENLHVHHVYFDGGAERKKHGRGTLVNKIWHGVKNGNGRYQLLCQPCHKDAHAEHRLEKEATK